jgi:tRNA threonylcarbamoyladenosine biosynthesis protein TsaE
MSVQFTVQNEEQTRDFGRQLAGVLQAGDVVALHGNLGAGKTFLVRSIVAALDGEEAPVNSPTFVIVQRYDVRLPVYHIDAYRLADSDEFLDLGGEEILSDQALCLIEWAERIAQALPPDRLEIRIQAVSPEARQLTLSGAGPRSSAIVEQLQATVGH